MTPKVSYQKWLRGMAEQILLIKSLPKLKLRLLSILVIGTSLELIYKLQFEKSDKDIKLDLENNEFDNIALCIIAIVILVFFIINYIYRKFIIDIFPDFSKSLIEQGYSKEEIREMMNNLK